LGGAELFFSLGRGGAFTFSDWEGSWGVQAVAPPRESLKLKAVAVLNFIRVKSRLDPYSKFTIQGLTPQRRPFCREELD
jgi:hypothetical protein